MLLTTAFVNIAEELAYRGYLFVKITEMFGADAAIAATSLVFLVLHVQSGVPWVNAVAGVLTCGLIYAAIFARWRSLPMAFGFHLANNYAQCVLGLRQVPLTIVEPGQPMRPAGATTVLVVVAASNLALAAIIRIGMTKGSWSMSEHFSPASRPELRSTS